MTEKLVNLYSKLKAVATAARDDTLSIEIMNAAHCLSAGEERGAAYLHTARGVGTWRAAAEVRTLAVDRPVVHLGRCDFAVYSTAR